jgi:hypothetical protein
MSWDFDDKQSKHTWNIVELEVRHSIYRGK